MLPPDAMEALEEKLRRSTGAASLLGYQHGRGPGVALAIAFGVQS